MLTSKNNAFYYFFYYFYLMQGAGEDLAPATGTSQRAHGGPSSWCRLKRPAALIKQFQTKAAGQCVRVAHTHQ